MSEGWEYDVLCVGELTTLLKVCVYNSLVPRPARRFVLQATKSWVGPGNEATYISSEGYQKLKGYSALQVEDESRNMLTLCLSNHPRCSNIVTLSSLRSVQTMQGSWSGHLHVGQYVDVCVHVCVCVCVCVCHM